jgi:hypothetical protein
MGPHKSDVHDFEFILDCHDESVFIPLNIENYSILSDYASGVKLGFDIVGISPLCLFRFSIPSTQRLLGIPLVSGQTVRIHQPNPGAVKGVQNGPLYRAKSSRFT